MYHLIYKTTRFCSDSDQLKEIAPFYKEIDESINK